MNDKIFYIKHINKTFHKMENMQKNLHNIAKNYFLLRKKKQPVLLFATFKQNISKLEVIHLYKKLNIENPFLQSFKVIQVFTQFILVSF